MIVIFLAANQTLKILTIYDNPIFGGPNWYKENNAF